MIQRNSTLAVLRESFVAGSDENLSPIMHHLWKMEGGCHLFLPQWMGTRHHRSERVRNRQKNSGGNAAGKHYPYQWQQQ